MPISTNKSIIISTNQVVIDAITNALNNTIYGNGITVFRKSENVLVEVDITLYKCQ